MEDASLQMSSVPTPPVLRSVPAGSWDGRPSLHAADITDSLAETKTCNIFPTLELHPRGSRVFLTPPCCEVLGFSSLPSTREVLGFSSPPLL